MALFARATLRERSYLEVCFRYVLDDSWVTCLLLGFSEFFNHLFNYAESPPAAGASGKINFFKTCLRQVLKKLIFPKWVDFNHWSYIFPIFAWNLPPAGFGKNNLPEMGWLQPLRLCIPNLCLIVAYITAIHYYNNTAHFIPLNHAVSRLCACPSTRHTCSASLI